MAREHLPADAVGQAAPPSSTSDDAPGWSAADVNRRENLLLTAALPRTIPPGTSPVAEKQGTTMSATIIEKPRPSPPPTSGSGRLWSPHMWEGCTLESWLRLLWRGRFRVGWRLWWVAAIITLVSCGHSVLRLVQNLRYGRRIRQVQLRRPPIFILGHWRTGTTFLHELLIRDPRHTFPTTYECFEPNHFLLTEKLMTRWFWFLAPTKRPMDNMAVGWERPQEDEFALCMLGQPSPYLTIAFPNNGPACTEYYDLVNVPAKARERWKKAFRYFLQAITFRNSKRLVLKSPPHMCRIPVLKEMYPDAVFIHIVRNPYVVFPSTVNLWKSLYRRQGMQTPHFAGLEEHVFQTFSHMHERLEETRRLVDDHRFFEVRYEDLVRDPLGQMREMYEHLDLGDFEEVRPRLESYLASVAGYETNHYELTEQQRAEIKRRWAAVIERYGYDEE
jgi:hypothetical protein